MSPFVKMCLALRDPDLHGNMFSCAFQFKKWYELLVGEVEKLLRHKDILESETSAHQTMTDFKARAKRCDTSGCGP